MLDSKLIKEIELCTIGDKTYTAVETPDGVTLVEQAYGDTIEITGVNYTAAEMRKIKKQVKANTPAIEEINIAVVTKIREKYSMDDEIKMLHCAPSQETTEWNDYVEDCRQWGREEKAKLGL